MSKSLPSTAISCCLGHSGLERREQVHQKLMLLCSRAACQTQTMHNKLYVTFFRKKRNGIIYFTFHRLGISIVTVWRSVEYHSVRNLYTRLFLNTPTVGFSCQQNYCYQKSFGLLNHSFSVLVNCIVKVG